MAVAAGTEVDASTVLRHDTPPRLLTCGSSSSAATLLAKQAVAAPKGRLLNGATPGSNTSTASLHTDATCWGRESCTPSTPQFPDTVALDEETRSERSQVEAGRCGVVVRCGRQFIGPIFSSRQQQQAALTTEVSPSRRCGGAPCVTGRREKTRHGCLNSPTAGSPRRASASKSPRRVSQATPRSGLIVRVGSPSPSVRVGSSVGSPRGGEQAALLASMASALRLVEPRYSNPLQARLDATVQHLDSAREQVREQNRQNLQLQRTAEEHRHLLKRVSSLEEQNDMFVARLAECSCGAAHTGVPKWMAEERSEWERCQLAAEDLSVERLRLLEQEAIRKRHLEQRRREASALQHACEEASRLDQRIEELTLVRSEAERMAVANRRMMKQIDRLCRHQRWRC